MPMKCYLGSVTISPQPFEMVFNLGWGEGKGNNGTDEAKLIMREKWLTLNCRYLGAHSTILFLHVFENFQNKR